MLNHKSQHDTAVYLLSLERLYSSYSLQGERFVSDNSSVLEHPKQGRIFIF
jgi:hypothetical protein